MAPNRLALYLTAVADFAAGIAAVAGGMSTMHQITVLGVATLLTTKAALFVRGWQEFEKANYQADLLRVRAQVEVDAHRQATQGQPPVSQVVGPPKVKLPR